MVEGIEMEPIKKKYTSSLYWSMMTVTTVGYGDINMINDWERLCAVVLMIFFNLLGAIIFGNITNIIASLGEGSARLRHRTKQLHEFINAYEIPLTLQRRLHDTLMYQWEYNRCEDMKDILDSYPQFLKRDCLMHIHLEFIRKVPFFAKVPDGFIRAIITQLQSELCLSQDIIIHEGDAAKEMYFLRIGAVDVYAPQSSRVVVTLKKGAFFGEIGLLMEKGRRMNTVVAVGQCEIFILTKTALDYALSKFPECKQSLNDAAIERLNLVRKQKVKSKWKNAFSKIKAINKSSRMLGIKLQDQKKQKWVRERVLFKIVGFNGPFPTTNELEAMRPGLKIGAKITTNMYLKFDLDGNEVQLTETFDGKSADSVVLSNKDFEFKHMRNKNINEDYLPSINISLIETVNIEGWSGGAQMFTVATLEIPLSTFEANKEYNQVYEMKLNDDILKHRYEKGDSNDGGLSISTCIRRLVLRKRLGSVTGSISVGSSGDPLPESLELQRKLSILAEHNKLNAEDLSSTSESEVEDDDNEEEEEEAGVEDEEKMESKKNIISGNDESEDRFDARRPSISALSNISISSQQNHEEIKRDVNMLKEELVSQRKMLEEMYQSFTLLMKQQKEKKEE